MNGYLALAMMPIAVLLADQAKADFTSETPISDAACANDVLDAEQAEGRLSWIVKCIIENKGSFKSISFEDTVDMRISISGKYLPVTRIKSQYPTFATSTNEPWIAPTDPTASCETPAAVAHVGTCWAKDGHSD